MYVVVPDRNEVYVYARSDYVGTNWNDEKK